MASVLKHMMVLILAACLFSPQTVFAHASLIQASPAPDSKLDQSPNEVVLAFNERLEKELFYIKVFNQDGASVTTNHATMDQQQSEIRLLLPELRDGLYTVAYKVISADGHPVSESYLFTIGQFDMLQQPNEGRNYQQYQLSSKIGLAQLMTFFSRLFYFLALLLLAGWTFWGLILRLRSQILKTYDLSCSLNLRRLFLLSVIFMVAVHLPEYLDSFHAGDLFSLLFSTSVGISWVSHLILAFAGFVILHRSKWIDWTWLLLLLASKSISGHALAFEPVFRTLILDLIHLFAASVWAGGLLYILLHWRKHKETVAGFLTTFSNYALVSMMILTVSGILSTVIFLPKLNYIFYTQWGNLLLAKCALVLLVFIVGAILRYWLRRKRQPSGLLIKMDAILMLLIVAIVSVFTVLTPQPANQPLHWHVMGETVHMTAKITPNAPGNNTFSVEVWMPEKAGKPKSVRLLMRYQDDKAVAPIEVPLIEAADAGSFEYLELEHYKYETEGPYLPIAGRWIAEVRVMDANDNETVYQNRITIY